MDNILIRKKKYGPIFKVRAGPRYGIFITRAREVEVGKTKLIINFINLLFYLFFIKKKKFFLFQDLITGMKNTEKSYVYKFVHSWLGTGLLTSHGKKWTSHRKLITPSFHFTVLQSFIEIFQENSNILVNKLNKMADTNEAIDIYPFITLCLLDIICGNLFYY